MYNPSHFEETRPEVLRALVAQHPLATVVGHTPEGLVADHIPLMLRTDAAGRSTLVGHVARQNPIWQPGADGQPRQVLAVFQGASAYISPNWYATKADGGKVVPTWNYAVVHASGPLQAMHDTAWKLDLLTALTHTHERAQPHPWQVSDAPADYTERLLAAIVGIEIPVVRWQGKWKVSQNQPAVNRHSVVAGLNASGDPAQQAMANLVEHAPCR